jgi:hypothetical protein
MYKNMDALLSTPWAVGSARLWQHDPHSHCCEQHPPLACIVGVALYKFAHTSMHGSSIGNSYYTFASSAPTPTFMVDGGALGGRNEDGEDIWQRYIDIWVTYGYVDIWDMREHMEALFRHNLDSQKLV